MGDVATCQPTAEQNVLRDVYLQATAAGGKDALAREFKVMVLLSDARCQAARAYIDMASTMEAAIDKENAQNILHSAHESSMDVVQLLSKLGEARLHACSNAELLKMCDAADAYASKCITTPLFEFRKLGLDGLMKDPSFSFPRDWANKFNDVAFVETVSEDSSSKRLGAIIHEVKSFKNRMEEQLYTWSMETTLKDIFQAHLNTIQEAPSPL